MISNTRFQTLQRRELLQSFRKQIDMYQLTPFVNAVLKEDEHVLNEDILVQFIANYDRVQQVSKAEGYIFQVNKDALADALDLPKTFIGEVDEDHLPPVDRTKIDYTVFLDTFVLNFMYLNHEADVAHKIHKMRRPLMKGHPDLFDFAGFMWCLVENELLQGNGLEECYYGCHIQSLMRRQHPKVFDGDKAEDCGEAKPEDCCEAKPEGSQNSDKRNSVDRPRSGGEAIDKSRMWKVTEISEPSQCRSSRLPDNTSSLMRVTNLVYTNSGHGVLALAANAVHKLWKWPKSDRNTSGKATTSMLPQLWQPTSGILMTNDISDTNPEDSVACFTLSKNDSYVISASGGKISLFNMMTFKTMTAFMPPPPVATFLAFHPNDNNIVAIGMDDASIQIFSVRLDEVQAKLKGHQKRITGLAFSHLLGVLVSSSADAMLCVWNAKPGYEKQTSTQLQIPRGRVAAPSADTRVQFHQDQTHLLVVHETQIAIFEAPRLECLKQWGPREASGPITNASYSCDSQSIYVTFEDGSIGILTASTLQLRCRISSTAYLPSNPTSRVYPLVVAAHPSEPNQFALGLTDGGVCLIEPLESEGKWGTSAGPESVAGPSTMTVGVANTTDQSHR